jgi:hypothetical protein
LSHGGSLHKDKKRRQQRQGLRNKLFEILGSTEYVRCGFGEPRICLQFDHRWGGGKIEINLKRWKDVKFFRYYINCPDKAKGELQVLCANCNAIKRHEQYKAPIRGLLI